MDILAGIVVFGALVLYFLPTVIAGRRNAAQHGGIFAVNLFFGWTIIGWIAALIWACTDSQGSGNRRDCPFCAEKIMPQAIVCPHCRRDIPNDEPPQRMTVEAAAPMAPVQAAAAGAAKFALMMVVLAGIFVIAAFWWTGKPIIGGKPSSSAGSPIYATGAGVSPCSEFGDNLAQCEFELKKRGIAFPRR
jgi:hypothetical protein